MTEHPDLDLSAYLDEALEPTEQASVQAHIERCEPCRQRLAELRATSRLLAALPELVPTRSLLPRRQHGWLWLRPVRLLGSIGTGTFLFLFLASYVVNSGSSLGGGTSSSETLAAQGKFGAAASAFAVESSQRAAAGAAASTPLAAAAPAAVASQPAANADSARSSAGPALTPGAGKDLAVATGAITSARETGPREFGPPPATFLALALLSAIAAFMAHRRLRRSHS
ncbi:MAG: zf-HC2 domain-containing protein [Chloroflexota bacterium]